MFDLSPRATFYFDLGSPYAYLTAERVSALFTEAGLEQPEWQPILLGGLFRHFERDSWGNGPEREVGMAEVERRAAAGCELHPKALLKAVGTEHVKNALREATDGAAERGVTGVPALVIGDQVFWGDDRVEEAVAAAS